LKYYVWLVLLYGMEGWALKVNNINQLEVFEMWLYRRMLKIPWTARMTNVEVPDVYHQKEKDCTPGARHEERKV